MWAKLREQMALDPPVKMTDNQYLGSTQRDMVPYPVNVEEMSAAFEIFPSSLGNSQPAWRTRTYAEMRKHRNRLTYLSTAKRKQAVVITRRSMTRLYAKMARQGNRPEYEAMPMICADTPAVVSTDTWSCQGTPQLSQASLHALH